MVPMSELGTARRVALGVELAAVVVTSYANVAEAPRSVPGVVLALVAPVFLGLAIVLWHRAHRVLAGRAGAVFTTGLAGIAAMCFVVSYTHIRDLALASGQSELAAGLLPLVIDGTVVLSSVVVLACGRHMKDLATAQQAEAETERLARRAAEDDARRQVELEQVRAERVAAEAEAEQSRIAAEAEAERLLLAERRAAADAVVEARRTAGRKASTEDTEAAVAAFLAAHAGDRSGRGPTVRAVAEALGVTTRTVQRTQAWAGRHSGDTARQGAERPAKPASGTEQASIDDETTALETV